MDKKILINHALLLKYSNILEDLYFTLVLLKLNTCTNSLSEKKKGSTSIWHKIITTFLLLRPLSFLLVALKIKVELEVLRIKMEKEKVLNPATFKKQ